MRKEQEKRQKDKEEVKKRFQRKLEVGRTTEGEEKDKDRNLGVKSIKGKLGLLKC